MSKDEMIVELVELVLTREMEIKKLSKKIASIKQYIEFYDTDIEERHTNDH